MRFGPFQKTYFNTSDGAYSLVTEREVKDSQITLTGEETDVALSFFGRNNIFRGNVKTGGPQASKSFYLYDNAKCNVSSNPISLNLVFPKPEKDELRLYLKTGIFKPEANQVWFIYEENNRIILGAMEEKSWRMLGRDDPDDETYIEQIYTGRTEPVYKTTVAGKKLVRNPALAIASFRAADHKCEVDPSHKLFTSRSTGMPFLEAHHLIPMKFQQIFKDSLDFQDNVVSLCPHCHRLVHHATPPETKVTLDILFDKRKTTPEIKDLTISGLYSLYSCEKID